MQSSVRQSQSVNLGTAPKNFVLASLVAPLVALAGPAAFLMYTLFMAEGPADSPAFDARLARVQEMVSGLLAVIYFFGVIFYPVIALTLCQAKRLKLWVFVTASAIMPSMFFLMIFRPIAGQVGAESGITYGINLVVSGCVALCAGLGALVWWRIARPLPSSS